MDKVITIPFIDGYCFIYIDVKQAEPRTIFSAIGSELVKCDDIYLHLAHGDKGQRDKIKKNFLASLYSGNIANALPSEYGEDLNKIIAFEQELADYAEQTDYLKTKLGEKISTTKDKALNTYAQSLTAVLLAAFFENVVSHGRGLGIDITPVFFQHDAIIYQFPIKWFLHIDLLIRKYFRAACKKYFDIDYPYKKQLLLKNWADKYSYDFQLNKMELTLCLPEVGRDYFLSHLAQNYSFRVMSKTGQSITIKLIECLPNIDWWFLPFEKSVEEHLNNTIFS